MYRRSPSARVGGDSTSAGLGRMARPGSAASWERSVGRTPAGRAPPGPETTRPRAPASRGRAQSARASPPKRPAAERRRTVLPASRGGTPLHPGPREWAPADWRERRSAPPSPRRQYGIRPRQPADEAISRTSDTPLRPGRSATCGHDIEARSGSCFGALHVMRTAGASICSAAARSWRTPWPAGADAAPERAGRAARSPPAPAGSLPLPGRPAPAPAPAPAAAARLPSALRAARGGITGATSTTTTSAVAARAT